MTIGTGLKKIKEALLAIYGANEAHAIAVILAEHVTGLSRMQQVVNRAMELSVPQQTSISNAMEQLLRHRPVQYVLGEAWFMGLKLYVNDFVLIPRPETEELVKLLAAAAGHVSRQHILDIGTGSGCIPVALKKLLPLAMITAVDVSREALEIARRNATLQETFIDFLQVDFLDEESWPRLPKYDFLISNPPYIPVNEKEKLDRNVADWEPGLALFVANNDPLLFYSKIALFGQDHLNSNGKIFVEIHQDYAEMTLNLFAGHGYDAFLKKDMYNNDRMIIAEKCTKNYMNVKNHF